MCVCVRAHVCVLLSLSFPYSFDVNLVHFFFVLKNISILSKYFPHCQTACLNAIKIISKIHSYISISFLLPSDKRGNFFPLPSEHDSFLDRWKKVRKEVKETNE